jgi:hypothetical protein
MLTGCAMLARIWRWNDDRTSVSYRRPGDSNSVPAAGYGRGTRLVEVATERGITFEVVRVWRGDRGRERRLKNRKEGPTLCPICNPEGAGKRACAGGISLASALHDQEGDGCPL